MSDFHCAWGSFEENAKHYWDNLEDTFQLRSRIRYGKPYRPSYLASKEDAPEGLYERLRAKEE